VAFSLWKSIGITHYAFISIKLLYRNESRLSIMKSYFAIMKITSVSLIYWEEVTYISTFTTVMGATWDEDSWPSAGLLARGLRCLAWGCSRNRWGLLFLGHNLTSG
jgi:hypothetical protein